MQTGDDPFFIIWTFSFFVSRNWNGLWRRGRRPLLHHLHCSTRLLQTMGNQYGHWFADTSINRPLTNPLFSIFFTPVTEALKVYKTNFCFREQRQLVSCSKNKSKVFSSLNSSEDASIVSKCSEGKNKVLDKHDNCVGKLETSRRE